jgi:hypothetical protein
MMEPIKTQSISSTFAGNKTGQNPNVKKIGIQSKGRLRKRNAMKITYWMMRAMMKKRQRRQVK